MKTHYIQFDSSVESGQIDEALRELEIDKTRRVLGVCMPDNSYHVIGEIVKFDDCPQEVFDQAMELLGNLAYEHLR